MAAGAILREPFYEVAGQIAIDLPGAVAVFTTRRGGSSEGPYDSLNLGVATADDPQRVRANHAWLERTFGVKLAYGRQVHGNHVRHTETPTSWLDQLADADAIVTSTAGVAPMVFAADCVPVVICADGAIAVVHAGWKGLASGVLAAGARALHGLAPVNAAMQAAIGPAAGPCCYEVSEELHRVFDSAESGFRHADNLDLKAIAAQQLRQAGVGTVHDVGICTICERDGLLFSHRRDHGVTGRQGALAWLT